MYLRISILNETVCLLLFSLQVVVSWWCQSIFPAVGVFSDSNKCDSCLKIRCQQQTFDWNWIESGLKMD